MHRRKFLQTSAYMGLGAVLSNIGIKASAALNAPEALFGSNLSQYPLLKGWQGLTQDLPETFVPWQALLPINNELWPRGKTEHLIE